MITLSSTYTLTLEEVCRVAYGEEVSIETSSLEELERRRREVEHFVSVSQIPAYGFNRGFGHNVDVAVEPQLLQALQENLLRSHSCGVGPCAPPEVVRATMLLRAHSLLRGHSGVRPILVTTIITCLNNNIIPAVPFYGSVGASGDLAPLSHIGLALIGEGDVLQEHGTCSAREAMERKGITPLALEMKEGLALCNGSQFTNALGILAHQQIERVLKTAAMNTALAVLVMLGSDSPFDEELQKLRPFSGSIKVAGWIREFLQGAPLREVHKAYDIDGEVQDPYNLRCAPHILGACEELISEAGKAFEIEANSATDNPLILQDSEKKWTRILSGGHFHGMPLAIRLHGLQQAMGIIASLTNARCQRYVDANRNKGLGNVLLSPDLTEEERQVSSGMMIPEYVSAALTNWIVGASSPSHLFSLPTDAGQEDHVSMGTNTAIRVWETVSRAAEVVAIELCYAAQAAWIRKQLEYAPTKHSLTKEQHTELFSLASEISKKAEELLGEDFLVSLKYNTYFKIPKSYRFLSSLGEKTVEEVQEVFKPVTADRVFSNEIKELSQRVLKGKFTFLDYF